MGQFPDNVTENKSLHNRAFVFHGRKDAGEALVNLLGEYAGSDVVVAAIPAGGVPVAAVVAAKLKLALTVLVVSKITLPWNTEAGYGAVAADGTCKINEPLAQQLRLDEATREEGIRKTVAKVEQRERLFRQVLGPCPLAGRTVVLVDDGLASGFTMRVAVASVRNQGAGKIIVAVPTGHGSSVTELAGECDHLYCANIREGMRYAVAEAYEQWSDVSEAQVMSVLEQFQQPQARA